MAKQKSKTRTKTKAKTRTRSRSPNYPLVGLEPAIEHTRLLYDLDKRHQVPILLAHERWNYTRGGSAGNQCTAALKAYGMINVEGKGDNRKLSVTEIGERIIRDAPDRVQRLRQAALGPAIHAELWARYRGSGLPSDDVIRNYLVWERENGRFNEDVVDGVIRRFRDTIEFANLDSSYIIDDKVNGSDRQENNGGELEKPPRRHRITRDTHVSDKPREEVFMIPEGGEIVLQFPASMSRDTFTDFQDWLKIVVRKIGRLVQEDKTDEQELDDTRDS